MMRKLFWVLAVFVGVGAVFSYFDRRERERRRQLWAEATDRL